MAAPVVPFQFPAVGTPENGKVQANFEELLKYLRERNDGTVSWDSGLFAGDVSIIAAESGSALTLTLSNTSNTASSQSLVDVVVAGTTADDAFMKFRVTGGGVWSLGVDNSDSDKFKLDAASLLGSGSGTLLVGNSTTTEVAIHGTNTNDAPVAGFVGEYVESSDSTGNNAAASGSFSDITSISLTAGDWSIHGHVIFTLNGATASADFIGAISVHSGATTTDHVSGKNMVNTNAPTSQTNSHVTIGYRLLLAATTTVYLKGRCGYSAGTPLIHGTIWAERRR